MCDTYLNIPENGLHFVCRICLEAEGVREMTYKETSWYQNVVNVSPLPSPCKVCVCWVCSHLIRKYMRFSYQCQRANYLLTQQAQDTKTTISNKAHNFIRTKPTTDSIPPCNVYVKIVKLENTDTELDSVIIGYGNDETAVSDNDSVNIVKDEVDIEDIDISTVSDTRIGGQIDKPQRTPRKGFSLRMRQETEKYRGIKHTETEPKLPSEESVDKTVAVRNNVANNILKKLQCPRIIPKKPKEEYKCYKCDVDFPDWAELAQHLTQHVSSPSVVIPKLRLPSDAEDDWCEERDEPSSRSKPATAYKTPQQILTSQRKPLSIKTQDDHHNIAIFPKMTDVEKHVKEKHVLSIKKHVTDKFRCSFKCTFCDKSFRSFSCVQVHENGVHTKKTFYQCDTCKKQFRYKCALKKHIIVSHLGLPKRYTCDRCSYACNDRTNMKRHTINVHEKNKMFSCDICGRQFSDKRFLIGHLNKHEGVKKKKCPKCPKKFYDVYALRIHMRTHEKVTHWKQYRKQFTCEICCKEFWGAYVFNRHKQTHIKRARRKRHPCVICGNTYSRPDTLKKHIEMTHHIHVSPSTVLIN